MCFIVGFILEIKLSLQSTYIYILLYIIIVHKIHKRKRRKTKLRLQYKPKKLHVANTVNAKQSSWRSEYLAKNQITLNLHLIIFY